MKKIQNDLTPPRELVPSLSERLDWAIMRAMSADPDMRPAIVPRVRRGPDRPQHAPRCRRWRRPTPQDMWYLVYKDEDGDARTR